jgi:hypothetical protein
VGGPGAVSVPWWGVPYADLPPWTLVLGGGGGGGQCDAVQCSGFRCSGGDELFARNNARDGAGEEGRLDNAGSGR